MRIITGDECGLLKEVIPELSRPPPTTDVNNSDGAAATAIHVGKARPSATSIQAAAAAQMQHGSGVSGGSGGFVSSGSAAPEPAYIFTFMGGLLAFLGGRKNLGKIKTLLRIS